MLRKMLAKLTDRRQLPENISYEEARTALETHNMKLRRELAGREDVEPEILYYLAEDDSAEVRALVAKNKTTPIQADQMLADDEAEEVRCELANKIARLIPGLSDEETASIRDMAIEILEKLAQDHAPRVRKIIAEEIKDSTEMPRSIVRRLAKDLEIVVCGPILQYSPLLSDDDLLEIVATTQVEGAITAIAGRSSVSAEVSDAVVASLEIPAVAALLVNPNAQIREETLDKIIDNAEQVEEWHQPIVMRPDLSQRAIRRIAGFVAGALLEKLVERNDIDKETQLVLNRRVRERIATEELDPEQVKAAEQAEARVRDAYVAGDLDDGFVAEAARAGDRAAVLHAISLMARVPMAAIERIIASRNGKAITSICWRAGLSMRTALKVQVDIAHVAPADQVLARDGVDYSLTDAEMSWHLEYFGL